MFPFERNEVRPLEEDSYESWHQVIPVPLRPATTLDERYNWGDIDALFEEQAPIFTFNPRIEVPPETRTTSKRQKNRVLGKTKLKRLGKPRTGVKRVFQSEPGKERSSKGGPKSLRLRKRGTPIIGMLQKIQKKLKKRNQKHRRSVVQT